MTKTPLTVIDSLPLASGAIGFDSGTSERGGRLEGRISQEADSQGEHELTATVTPPEGQSANLSSKAAKASPGEARLIVSEDLHVVGGGRRDGDKLGFQIACSYEGSSGYL